MSVISLSHLYRRFVSELHDLFLGSQYNHHMSVVRYAYIHAHCTYSKGSLSSLYHDMNQHRVRSEEHGKCKTTAVLEISM